MDESGNESDENYILLTSVRGNYDQNDEDHSNLIDILSQKKVCNISFILKC
jgi:hypothetical protein